MYQQTRIAKHFRFVRNFRAKVTDSLNKFRLKLIVYSTKDICGDMEILMKKAHEGFARCNDGKLKYKQCQMCFICNKSSIISNKNINHVLNRYLISTHIFSLKTNTRTDVNIYDCA